MATCPLMRRVSALTLAITLSLVGIPRPVHAAGDETPPPGLTFQGHPLSDLPRLAMRSALLLDGLWGQAEVQTSEAPPTNGEVRGVVLGPAGQPLVRHEVVLDRFVTLGGRDARVSRRTVTDESGRFAFTSLPAGSFEINVVVGDERLTVPVVLTAAAMVDVEVSVRDAGADWVRLRDFTPGAPLTVRVDGAPDREMMFLSADDAGLNVLATDVAALPDEADRYLRFVLATSPEFFTEPSDRSYEDQASGIRVVAMEGVFIGGRKVAEWAEVVTFLPRTDFVRRIPAPRGRVLGEHVQRGHRLGAAIGAGLGVLLVASATERSPGAFALAGLLGGLGGVFYGSLIGTAVGAADAAGRGPVWHFRQSTSSATLGVSPLLAPHRKGMLVSVGF